MLINELRIAFSRGRLLMAGVSEAERKQIECWTALKEYLDKIFADQKLEKLLFDGRHDIELFRAENVEIDTKGTKAAVVYGINCVGAYRRIEGADLFQNQFTYRWGHFNSPFVLAFALAADSKNTLKPDDLEARLGPYRQMAAEQGEAQQADSKPVSPEEHK